MYHVETEIDSNGDWIAYIVSEQGNTIAGVGNPVDNTEQDAIAYPSTMVVYAGEREEE